MGWKEPGANYRYLLVLGVICVLGCMVLKEVKTGCCGSGR